MLIRCVISESEVLYGANGRSSTYEHKAPISVSKRFLNVTGVPQRISYLSRNRGAILNTDFHRSIKKFFVRLSFGPTFKGWTSLVSHWGLLLMPSSAGTCGTHDLSPAKQGPYFLASFTKGNNFCDFLFAFPEDKALPKWGQIIKERICF